MLIGGQIVCGIASTSKTASNLHWASPSSRISSLPVQSPPSTAKSLTSSVNSSAIGFVFSDSQSVITTISHSGISSSFTTIPRSTNHTSSNALPNPPVFISSTQVTSLSSKSSRVPRRGDASQKSPRPSSPRIPSVPTTSRKSSSASAADKGTLSNKVAGFMSSRSQSYSEPTVSTQICSLCAENSSSIATSLSSLPRAQVRPTSSPLSARQTTANLPSSRTPSGVSSTPVAVGFTEQLLSGVTSYFNITATITLPPPGFTTISASNSQWTGDTTTVSHGTTYPVVYGCAQCGGRHHGIIVGGLGGKPRDPERNGCGSGILAIFRSIFGCGTEFIFPGLPPFIIDPLGDPVTSAPETDSGPHEEPSGKPRSNGPSLSQASSTPISSRAASSTSLCSPTSTPNLYAIFLVDGVTNAETESLSTYLQEEVGGPDLVSAIFLSVDNVASMFAALMDNCVASKIGSHPSVNSPPLRERQVWLILLGESLFTGQANTTRPRWRLQFHSV